MEDRFYADLRPVSDLSEAFRPGVFVSAPASWSAVITDVEGSTKAIQEGRYKDVNTLGVASIVAVQNALAGLEFPFVFGGDGASMLCPGNTLEQVVTALRGVRATARHAFSLSLRACVVPLKDINDAGRSVLVARLRTSPQASFALFGGGGLQLAERWIKDPERMSHYSIQDSGPAAASFAGFECRWNPIPSQNGAVASILIESMLAPENRPNHYQQLSHTFSQMTVDSSPRPVAVASLSLARNRSAFESEARLRAQAATGTRFRLARLRAQLTAAVGRVLLRNHWSVFGFPEDYREQVVANSDYQKFDDMLRMVLDLTTEQLGSIREYLDTEYRSGRLVYGIHSAPAATMTCMIGNYDGNHVHFVDGADGGYALAAKALKEQQRHSRDRSAARA